MQEKGKNNPVRLPGWPQALTLVLSILVLGMVLLTSFNVVARYVFQRVWIPLQELVVYWHATVFMLGAILTWLGNRHVRVDIFQQAFPARGKQKVETFGRWFLLLPFMIFMAVISFDYVYQAWLRQEGSAETGGLGGVYLIKSLLLLVPVLFILLLVRQSWQSRHRPTPGKGG